MEGLYMTTSVGGDGDGSRDGISTEVVISSRTPKVV